MYEWGYNGMPHAGMGFGVGWILMVLFWILLIVAIAVLIKWLIAPSGSRSSSDAPSPSRRTAMDLLRERYARGEIDHEEFEERKRRLED